MQGEVAEGATAEWFPDAPSRQGMQAPVEDEILQGNCNSRSTWAVTHTEQCKHNLHQTKCLYLDQNTEIHSTFSKKKSRYFSYFSFEKKKGWKMLQAGVTCNPVTSWMHILPGNQEDDLLTWLLPNCCKFSTQLLWQACDLVQKWLFILNRLLWLGDNVQTLWVTVMYVFCRSVEKKLVEYKQMRSLCHIRYNNQLIS